MASAIAHDLHANERTADIKLKDVQPFERMQLRSPLKRSLAFNKFVYPTVIQATAIPIAKAGIDLLLQSKSGTGKTLIFSVAVLEAFNTKQKLPHALIVVPTREIAIQIEDTLNGIGAYTPGFKAISCIGGMDIAGDRKRLQGAKAIVGTPGRLLHLIQNNLLNTSRLQIFVLDEADKLYTDSFRKDVRLIQKKLPNKYQTIACSATFPSELDVELSKIMYQPIFVSNSERSSVLVGIRQFVYILDEQRNSMLEMRAKLEALLNIFEYVTFKQCLIFAGSQSRADSYCNYLQRDGWPCELLSGAQSQSTRLETFQNFRTFRTRILIATDVMARGIDSERVNLVINLELPNNVVTYLHRIGRAGRFGTHGLAINLLTGNNQQEKFKSMLGSLGPAMSVYNYPLEPKADIDFWEFDSYDFPYYIEAVLNPPDEPTKTLPIDTNTYTKKELITPAVPLEANVAEETGNKQTVATVGALNTPILAGESLQSSTQQLAISNTIDDASSIKSDSSQQTSVHSKHLQDEETPVQEVDDNAIDTEERKDKQVEKKSDTHEFATMSECLDQYSSEDEGDITRYQNSANFEYYVAEEHMAKLNWLQSYDLVKAESSCRDELLEEVKLAIGIYETRYALGDQIKFVYIDKDAIDAYTKPQLIEMLQRLIDSVVADVSEDELSDSSQLAEHLKQWHATDIKLEDVKECTHEEYQRLHRLVERQKYTKAQWLQRRKKFAKMQKRWLDVQLQEAKIQTRDQRKSRKAFRKYLASISKDTLKSEEAKEEEQEQTPTSVNEYLPTKKGAPYDREAWLELIEYSAENELHAPDKTEWSSSSDNLSSDDSIEEIENNMTRLELEITKQLEEDVDDNVFDEKAKTAGTKEQTNSGCNELPNHFELKATKSKDQCDAKNNNKTKVQAKSTLSAELSHPNNGTTLDKTERTDLELLPALAKPSLEETIAKSVDGTDDTAGTEVVLPTLELHKQAATQSKPIVDACDDSNEASSNRIHVLSEEDSCNETKHFPSLAHSVPPLSVPAAEEQTVFDEQIVREKQRQLTISVGPQVDIPGHIASPGVSSDIEEAEPHSPSSVAGSSVSMHRYSPESSIENTVSSGFDEHESSVSSGIETTDVEVNSETESYMSNTETDDESNDEDDEGSEFDEYEDDDEDDDEQEVGSRVCSAEFVDGNDDDNNGSNSEIERKSDAEDKICDDDNDNVGLISHNLPSTSGADDFSEEYRAWQNIYWHQRKILEKYIMLSRQINQTD